MPSSTHRQACRTAADSIESLISLLVTTFGVGYISYIQAYCIYTAASVLVPDANAGVSIAATRLHILLDVLRGGLTTCPVFKRSLDIINHNYVPPTRSQAVSETSVDTWPAADTARNQFQPFTQPISAPAVPSAESTFTFGPTAPLNYMPAFPCLGMGLGGDDGPFMPSTLDSDLNFLDCFPESNMAAGDWFLNI